MKNLLEAANANLAGAPRPFPKAQQKLLKKVPAWTKHDELGAVVRDFPLLWESGRVALAARVMANRALYQPGDDDSAMAVIWSEDPRFAENPRELAQLAREVFDLKTEPEKDAQTQKTAAENELEAFAKVVSDELSRPFALAVPREIAGETPVFFSALLVLRAHLPGGFLSSTFLPLLVCPEKSQSAAILPASLWPDSWKDR